jgi:hypothetical protein
MSVKKAHTKDVLHCPYRYRGNDYVVLSVKTFQERVEIALANTHTRTIHLVSNGILSVKQRSTVRRAVRSSPQAVGSQVHANMENFIPCKQILFDVRSQNAALRLIRNELSEIMSNVFLE